MDFESAALIICKKANSGGSVLGFTFLLNLSFGFGAPEASSVCMHSCLRLLYWQNTDLHGTARLATIAENRKQNSVLKKSRTLAAATGCILPCRCILRDVPGACVLC